MRLGLLGYPLSHSKSPELYRKFLGNQLTSYELFEIKSASDIPDLNVFSEKLDGLSITSPWKRHFFSKVIIKNELVKSLGAINTIGFTDDGAFATNTDLVAVVETLKKYKSVYGDIHITLLGDGVMAEITSLVARSLQIPLKQFSRKQKGPMTSLDLSKETRSGQTIIINACSREFVFSGPLKGKEIFWDYNYAFPPHAISLPQLVMSYQDGREMLELQAHAALNFWRELNPKLK